MRLSLDQSNMDIKERRQLMEINFGEYLPQKDGKQIGLGEGSHKCSPNKLSLQHSLKDQVNYMPRNQKRTGIDNFKSRG